MLLLVVDAVFYFFNGVGKTSQQQQQQQQQQCTSAREKEQPSTDSWSFFSRCSTLRCNGCIPYRRLLFQCCCRVVVVVVVFNCDMMPLNGLHSTPELENLINKCESIFNYLADSFPFVFGQFGPCFFFIYLFFLGGGIVVVIISICRLHAKHFSLCWQPVWLSNGWNGALKIWNAFHVSVAEIGHSYHCRNDVFGSYGISFCFLILILSSASELGNISHWTHVQFYRRFVFLVANV